MRPSSVNPPRPFARVIDGGAIAGSIDGDGIEAGGPAAANAGTTAVLRRMRSVEVRAQVAAVATDHHPRDRVEQSPLRHADAIAAQQVCAARSVFPGPPRSVVE